MAIIPPELKGIPTIFGEVLEKNVTFCIDTSGSMYKSLDVVKEHLIETLLKHANKPPPRSFNILEFNSDVTQWADKMVKCSPQTVTVATDWIKNLTPKTGTNTQGALLTALSDSACGAVYIVTDGLADQHPVDILDSVYDAARGRPIHCIYLSSEERTDSVAVELLEDLAVESYGSFHIITLTTHGCVERITPIYRADHAAERLVRTANGTIHSQDKMCSMSTSLAVDPEESLYLTPRVNAFGHYAPYLDPVYPYQYPGHAPWLPWNAYPFRYYYPHGWSRYRPARNYLKAKDAMLESIEGDLSPAAGALLIGKSVLARRMDDGYFYQGTVKSQILSDKFLVAFGPCKHGKYKDTTYQDTYVYDIIDYEDAKRHTILAADRVLAPWEADGERFAPGIVIDGHEKRQAPGPEDDVLTVTFSNGKTSQVPPHTAIWTPTTVYERLALELKMPKEAREKLQSQDEYPKESLPGYPTSGPEAEPEEFGKAPPFEFDLDPMVLETRPWLRPYIHVPLGQTLGQTMTQRTKSAVQSEEISKLVPGTTLTNGELEQKISMQLNEHKQLLDEQEKEKEGKDKEETYLGVSDKQKEEQRVREEALQLRQERERAELREKERIEMHRREEERRRDEQERQRFLEELRRKEEVISGKRHLTETEEIENRLQEQKLADAYGEWKSAEWELALETERLEHIARLEEIEKLRELGGDRLLQKRQKQEENMFKKSVSFRGDNEVKRERPQSAQVLRSDTGEEQFDYRRFAVDDMDMSRRSRLGLYRRSRKKSPQRPPWKKYWKSDTAPEIIAPNTHGAFRETALQCPLEARDQRGPYVAEWGSPMFKYVDNYATHDYSNSVELLMKHPQPPPPSRTRVEVKRQVVQRHPAEEKEERRMNFRRQQVINRQQAWDKRSRQEDSMKELMQDQHRERVIAQLERDHQRQIKEQETVEKAREAKKHISAEIRSKIEANQLKERERDQQRIDALRQRRERREAIQGQRAREVEQVEKKRQEVKEKNSQARWDSHHQRLIYEDNQNHTEECRVRAAKINRIQHFRKLEEHGQMRKDARIGITNQHIAMYQSQVLP
ncbi:uncharacterized protein LOC127724285 [Mytilus californianus]|uniref:uncharacterized protein LOC127724285 n=1 Tax=Mytilus californianus TaxID=6549 RepID=UPI0022452DBC|nr:uncharacterized protein LOC127724285 [Mytilus californianus]